MIFFFASFLDQLEFDPKQVIDFKNRPDSWKIGRAEEIFNGFYLFNGRALNKKELTDKVQESLDLEKKLNLILETKSHEALLEIQNKLMTELSLLSKQ
jgi:hypothetical protein